MNALEVIQRATKTVGIPTPNVALASTDVQVVQLVELLNNECRELGSRYPWQALTFEQTFLVTRRYSALCSDTLSAMSRLWLRYVVVTSSVNVENNVLCPGDAMVDS